MLALSERTGTRTHHAARRPRASLVAHRALARVVSRATASRADACYVFVLVDSTSNRVVGISAIEAAVGLNEPWYNYHVGTIVHASRALVGLHGGAYALPRERPHRPHRALLALSRPGVPPSRKNGPLLAKSRLLFIADFADRFAPKVIAELRGKLDADGRSPFWEGLGRHFFAMEYTTADYLTGIGQKAFVAELMPRHPVYVNLLPESARAVIGEVHADTQPARAMLEQEGFRYEGYIDIFDAGPTVECFRDNIHAVRGESRAPRRDRRRRAGSRQPEARRRVARDESPLRRLSRRAPAGARARSTAFRSCPTRPRSSASPTATSCARSRCRRETDDGESPSARRRTPPSTSTASRVRRTTTRASRAATSPPSGTRVRSPTRATPRCRDSPRCARSRRAAMRRRCCRRTSGRSCPRCARSVLPAATREIVVAGRALGAADARRMLVGGGDVGRQRGDGESFRRHRRWTRPFHAGEPRQPFPPLARGCDDHPRAACDLCRHRRISPCTIRSPRRRSSATKVRPITPDFAGADGAPGVEFFVYGRAAYDESARRSPAISGAADTRSFRSDCAPPRSRPRAHRVRAAAPATPSMPASSTTT